jgi:hypothetical protein
VLIGTNDVLATTFPNFRRFATRFRGLSQPPSVEAFRANLMDTTGRIRDETNASVGPEFSCARSESPGSDDPTPAKLNTLFADYSQVITEVAARAGALYIPLYERFVDAMRHAGTQKPFTRLSFRALYRGYLLREFVQRRSFDEIARINGWQFPIDGIRLNTRGGTIRADVVEGFLDS